MNASRRPALLPACTLALLTLAGACSNSSTPAPVTPQLAPALLAGTWTVELTVAATTCSEVTVGQTQSRTVQIEVTGNDAVLTDDEGATNGPIVGTTVQFEKPNTSITLRLDGENRLLGQAIDRNPGSSGQPCTLTLSIVAVRSDPPVIPPIGNTITITQGPWLFEFVINGSSLFFDGVLTQNGAELTFDYIDGAIVSTWTGNLLDTSWIPTVTGTLPFAVEGAFNQDGTTFTGTVQSAVLGNGTITGTPQ